jgi:hypothetical protein
VAKKANDDDALDIEISEVHDLLSNLGQRLLETAKTASDLEIEGIWRARFGVITRARRLITALDEQRRKT